MNIRFLKNSLLLAVVFSILPVVAGAQTGLTVLEIYEEAVRLFNIDERSRAEDLFIQLDHRLCNNEDLAEECVEGTIYRAALKRYERDTKAAGKLLSKAAERAAERLEETHRGYVYLYVQKMYYNEHVSEMGEALKWSDKAVEIVENKNLDGLEAAWAYSGRGFIQDGLGNYHDAVAAYKKALLALENTEQNLSSQRLFSMVHNNVGVSYRRLGMLDDAMEHYQEAFRIVSSAFGSEHRELGLIYNSIGTVYYSQGDVGTAAEYFLRSANIFRLHHGENNEKVAAAFNNVGLSYFRTDDLNNALVYLERAQRIKENLLGGDHPETAIGYSNLASIYAQDNQYNAARINFERSIAVRKRFHGEGHPSLVTPKIQFSDFYYGLGEMENARGLLEKALQIVIYRLGELHPYLPDIHYKIGNSWQNEGQFNRAESSYQKALEYIVEGGYEALGSDDPAIHYPLQFIEVVKKMADLRLESYKTDRQIQSLYEAVELYEIASENVELLQTQYQSEASKLNLIDKNYSIYTQAIDALYKLYEERSNPELLNQIFTYAEKSRSRIALELLQEVQARNYGGVPDDIISQERELNSTITRYYQNLNSEQQKGFDADQELIKSYRDSLFYAQRELEIFTRELENNYPGYFNLKYEMQLADRDQVSQLLSDHEAMITYVLSETNSYAILLKKNSLHVQQINISDGLADRVESVRSAVVGGVTARFKEDALLLYRELIEPLVPHIEAESLIIIPDQILHYLPFEMLLTKETASQSYHKMPYLIREKRIQYAPSATMLRMMEENRPVNPRNLFAMAPFNQSPVHSELTPGLDRYMNNLAPLPLTSYETREIVKIFEKRRSFWDFFNPQKTELLLNGEATRYRLMEEPLQNYGYIHFATHAYVNESNPALSGIMLQSGNNNDGVVYVSDIYNLQMNADLVVLGACETGLGSVHRGEGLIGFTRAFLYAGASNLVVSLWKVNDQPTAKLMIRFYQGISEGYTYSESLHRAKLELIEHPELAAPRNWAAFILNGR